MNYLKLILSTITPALKYTLSIRSDSNLNNFKSLIRNELPHETYLELAVSYVNRGLNYEAEKVLENAPSYPVVYYWLAYFNRGSSPEKSNSISE